MHYYKLDENNWPVPCDITEYIKWDVGDIRRVAFDEKDGVSVSTVFLGINHSFDRRSLVLWETMVFGVGDDDPCERYTSHEDAVKGHAAMVEKYLTEASDGNAS